MCGGLHLPWAGGLPGQVKASLRRSRGLYQLRGQQEGAITGGPFFFAQVLNGIMPVLRVVNPALSISGHKIRGFSGQAGRFSPHN